MARASMTALLNGLANGSVHPHSVAPTPPPAACAWLASTLPQVESMYLDALSYRLQMSQTEYNAYAKKTQQEPPAVFTIDLNQFISTADRARILLWVKNPLPSP